MDRYSDQEISTFPKRVEGDQQRTWHINHDQQAPVWDMGTDDQWNSAILYINGNSNPYDQKTDQVKTRKSITQRFLIWICYLEGCQECVE